MNETKDTTAPTSKKIAIIGTEGAGKTVFVTVWSKLLERQEEGKPFIVPDPSTYAYIEKNWSKLQNGQWPESTPQSEFVNLSWRLKTPSGSLCQINVCDVAGHDIRRLFTGNKPQVSDDPTKAIYDTVAAADIVLVIINLKDFITASETQRIDNCANLLSMLQYMFDQKKKVALVFSQWHEYEAWVTEHGSIEAVLSAYMPSIYNTCCLEEVTNYFKVAAVVETTPSVEGGISITNPAANFTSAGFYRLNEWISTVVDGKSSLRHRDEIMSDTRMNFKKQGYRYIKDPTSLTKFLKIALWISLGISVLSLLADFMEMSLLCSDTISDAAFAANDARQGFILWPILVVNIVTFVTFLRWLYRTNSNCHGFGAQDMKFTPGWSIGYCIIPIISLYMPYRIMKEIWKVSINPANWQNEKNSPLLGWWGALWVISSVLVLVLTQLAMRADTIILLQASTTVSILSGIIELPYIIVTISLVSLIFTNQEQLVRGSV